MRSFEYTIKDKLGIHARPAGMLAKCAKSCDSEITVIAGEREAMATKLMALMGLGVKCGDTVKITVCGGNEEESERIVKDFFELNL